MKIESTDQDIRTLLSSGYYKIPRFQRPYSWDRENIQEFWDDIIRDNPLDYFIGSMVVFKTGSQYYGVVDGQQRLTTITILLCVLRNTLSELDFKDFAEGIHGLVEKRNIDNKLEFILTPESSYPFFQDHIQKWGKPDVPISPLKEEQNLQGAFEQLEKLVGGIIDSIHTDTTMPEEQQKEKCKEKLIQVRDALLDLKLIFIRLEDEDDAYIIFETLNTRGKDLSLTDLVKNHLSKHLKTNSASVDQSKIKWEKTIGTIQQSSIDLDTDTFLHHFWLSKYEYLPAKNLFKVLRKQVTKTKAKSFLNELLQDSSIYRAIHETSYGKWSKQEHRIEEALQALMLFRVRQQTPCVLSLVREYKANKIKKKHLEDTLVSIEKFHYLFTAVTSQRSSGGISSMYASLGRRLFEAADTHASVDIIRELKEKLRERIPSESEVIALFPEVIYTENFTKQRSLVKYTLVGLAHENTKGITVDFEQMTIEHLVPQSMIDQDDYSDANIGQLGNLILVSEDLNGKLKNKSFQDKKKILQNEGYDLFPDVLSLNKMSPEIIEERTKKLASQAYNIVWKF
jgi:hypothetical protein